MTEPRFAEQWARPLYKFIAEGGFVENVQRARLCVFPGGVGFAFGQPPGDKALRMELSVLREDGATERFLCDAHACGAWLPGVEEWRADRVPLFPFESPHGTLVHASFTYGVMVDGEMIPSRYVYGFARGGDFERGGVEQDVRPEGVQDGWRGVGGDRTAAYDALNRAPDAGFITPMFTRGNADRPEHPVHEIHRELDRVIARKRDDPRGRHTVRLAMFDFDNDNIATHLVFARDQGVEVECVGDWAQVSAMNFADSVTRLRRAGVPVLGAVRNNPWNRDESIASMHAKFILFDNEVVHCSSYNLHFHLWGGNYENALVFRSREVAAVYAGIYDAIRHGLPLRCRVDPARRFNIYYGFGRYHAGTEAVRPQDVIVGELAHARQSITVCMFEIGELRGRAPGSHRELGVVDALIEARNRGVTVRVLLNGMICHQGPLPAGRDDERPPKDAIRRLRDAWIEVFHVYYHESVYSPLHHKFAVIDGRTVLAGSYNWYQPSTASDEVLSVIRDDRLAGEFLGEVELMLRSLRICRS